MSLFPFDVKESARSESFSSRGDFLGKFFSRASSVDVSFNSLNGQQMFRLPENYKTEEEKVTEIISNRGNEGKLMFPFQSLPPHRGKLNVWRQ